MKYVSFARLRSLHQSTNQVPTYNVLTSLVSLSGWCVKPRAVSRWPPPATRCGHCLSDCTRALRALWVVVVCQRRPADTCHEVTGGAFDVWDARLDMPTAMSAALCVIDHRSIELVALTRTHARRSTHYHVTCHTGSGSKDGAGPAQHQAATALAVIIRRGRGRQRQRQRDGGGCARPIHGRHGAREQGCGSGDGVPAGDADPVPATTDGGPCPGARAAPQTRRRRQ